MRVSTRPWIAGTVQGNREKGLANAFLQQIRRCAQRLRPLLVLTDGCSAYPASIRRAFREKIKLTPGPGKACLQVWPDLHIGTVIKRTARKRVVEITRRMAHGVVERAEQLLASSRGGTVLNPAFLERLNGTFRERLASLTEPRVGMPLPACTVDTPGCISSAVRTIFASSIRNSRKRTTGERHGLQRWSVD